MAKLYFYYGVMNSSKTAQMLMVHHNYKELGRNVLVFKPSLDTRDVGVVRSRALSDEVEAVLVPTGEVGFMPNYIDGLKEPIAAVLVDEVQFLNPSQLSDLEYIVDILGIPVMAYGLMTDFKGALFPASQRLIELGARLVQVKTVCYYCNTAAVYNMRMRNGVPIFTGEQIEVGGNESYRVVCRKCYNRFKENYTDVEFYDPTVDPDPMHINQIVEH